MHKIIFLMLLIPVNGLMASEGKKSIQDTIETLGLSINHFSEIWPHYCKPHWQNTYNENLLATSELVKASKESGFLNIKYTAGVTYLAPGKTCKALVSYYLEGIASPLIGNFIKRDEAIRNNYGFSSLDLYKTSAGYFASYNTYNWTTEDVRFLEKVIERHRKANTFIIEEKIETSAMVKKEGEFKEIKVDPYAVYHLRPSQALITAHEKINQD